MPQQESLFLGDDVAPTSRAPINPAQQLDEAFLRRARRVVQSASAQLRREPSAAASPILRALLWTAEEKGESSQGNPSAPAPGATASDAARETAASSAESTIIRDVSGPSPSSGPLSAAAQVLARRGVLGALKDPALARREKKRAKLSTAPAAAEARPLSAAAAVSSPPSSSAALPWTARRLSEMTATSWKTLREHIGISVEVVQHKQPASARSGDGSGDTSSPQPSLHALFGAYGAPIRCWEEAGLPYALGKSVVQRYALPTAVQCQCVPLITPPPPRGTPFASSSSSSVGAAGSCLTHGFDVLAVADTGSGKSAGYLVPLLCQLVRDRPRLLGHEGRIALGPQALILVPTRELADQVMMEVQALLQCPVSPSILVADASTSTTLRKWHLEGQQAQQLGASPQRQDEKADSADRGNDLCELRVVKLVGGDDRDAQYNELARGTHAVIGTVGQLQSMLADRLLSLGNTTTLVMDEADRMIDESMKDMLVDVLQHCPVQRQTLLFTATLGPECAAIAKTYLAPQGYLLMRTSAGCASIRQSFEVFPTRLLRPGITAAATATTAPGKEDAASRKRGRAGAVSATTQASTGSWHRSVDPRIHPEKFARLVTWLVYTGSHGRTVVFANTKATCDALQEELEKEAAHLREQADRQSLQLLIGDAPDGLFFREHSGDRARDTAAVNTGPGRTHGEVCLDNLTSTAVVHSGLSRAERERLVQAFRNGHRRVLLTTDLLARGLDVKDVSLVVSYDVPRTFHEGGHGGDPAGDLADDEEAVRQYVHRVGRAGRAGATGVAVSFIVLPERLLTRAAQSRAAAAKARRTGTRSAFVWEGADGGAQQPFTEPHDDEDDNSEEGEESDAEARRSHPPRRRVEGGSGPAGSDSAAAATDAKSLYLSFPSDEPFLRPLWRFLLHCVTINVTLHPRTVGPTTTLTTPATAGEEEKDEEGEEEKPTSPAVGERTDKRLGSKAALEAVLHANRYAKVHLDDVLAELLFQLTRRSRYGTLTK